MLWKTGNKEAAQPKTKPKFNKLKAKIVFEFHLSINEPDYLCATKSAPSEQCARQKMYEWRKKGNFPSKLSMEFDSEIQLAIRMAWPSHTPHTIHTIAHKPDKEKFN